MLFLTASEKRAKIVSEALILYSKDDAGWFNEVRGRIDQSILINPGKREQVILKWIRSAEAAHNILVKDQILKVYDQRNSPQTDSN